MKNKEEIEKKYNAPIAYQNSFEILTDFKNSKDNEDNSI